MSSTARQARIQKETARKTRIAESALFSPAPSTTICECHRRPSSTSSMSAGTTLDKLSTKVQFQQYKRHCTSGTTRQYRQYKTTAPAHQAHAVSCN
eukprot:1868152-Rhodomonas_salina.1